MKAVRLLLSTLCALPLFANANAAGQVNYLNIDGDAVHFSTEETKSHTLPSCAVAATKDRYAFSLRTDAGRAMYSLLITAMAGKQAITVDSGQDCADVAGLERAEGISITPTVVPVSNANGGGKAFYLYKSDGTKLGVIASVINGRTTFYLDVNRDDRFSSITPTIKADILYFSNENCQGDVYTDTTFTYQLSHYHFNNNKLMSATSRRNTLPHSSYLDSGGECHNEVVSESKFKIVDFAAIHRICGDEACKIRHE